MGTVVMPKNSADLDVLNPILEFYYKKNTWVENSDYIAYIKKYLLDNGIDDKEREPQHYTKRMQILAYFGFIEWEEFGNSQSNRRVTALGKKFYEAVKSGNRDLVNEVILESLTKTVFGRNNVGAPASDSDVEAPVVCIRAILDLSYITKIEFAYLLYEMQDNGFTYSTIVKEIQDIRAGKLKPIQLPEEANKYTDWKPVNFLERFNFLETENSETRISTDVLKCYKNQLKNLKIYNVDKDVEFEDLFPSSPNATKLAEQYEQTIFYGVPGCGKSHLIKKTISDKLKIKDSETQIIRTVFHPEYTNADFVGQILPDLKDKTIVYKFVPGPFSQILKKALLDDKNNYVLIIEEINRGNSAAIFGELFQLLDRIKPYDSDAIGGNSYTEGWSEYFVMNSSINEYIRGAETETEKFDKAIDIFVDGNSKIHFSANTGIRLPPNLSILATMNTSDQNVFKLDNAFKRRWDLQLVPNEFGDENGELSKEEESQRNAEVEGFDFTWNEFRTAINEVISSPDNSFDSSSFSDKQLGCWFVKAENGKIKREVFVHKVLEYLWDDVFTFKSALVFKNTYKTFAALANSARNDKVPNIFSENFLHILNAQKQKSEDKETNSAAEKSQSETPENQQNQDL